MRARSVEGGPSRVPTRETHVRRHALAIAGALALTAPLLMTSTVQAADPGTPDRPVVKAVFSGPYTGAITLDWNPPFDNGTGAVTNYAIRYAEELSSTWSSPIVTNSTVTEGVVGGLNVNKTYVFQVQARNATGWGDWSATSISGDPQTGVNAPTVLKTNPGDGWVELSWTEPNPRALTYEIQYRTDVANSPWQPTKPFATGNNSYRVPELKAGVGYFFRVRSFNSEDDLSGWTVTEKAVAPLGAPTAPSNVQAYAGNAAVTVTWTAPPIAPSTYEVQYRAGNSAWSASTSTTATSINIPGLSNGVTYTFQVRSVRGTTASNWVESNAATPHPPVAPLAPNSVSAYGTDSAAVVSWTMQAGQPVTTYLIQYSLNNSQWFPTTPISTGRVDLSYILGGLTNGQPYYIRVAAANGVYTSAFTQMPGTVTPVSVPGPPQWLTGTPGNGQVSLTWQPPIIIGATSPITGYRVQYSSTGGAIWVSAPDLYSPLTSTTVTGLTNGTGYIFRVRATSYAGDGAWSAVSAVITPPGGPTPPTNVSAVPGDSRATVSWTAPASTSSAVIGYRVTAAPGGLSCTTSAVPPTVPATSCVVTGLTNGQAYTFTVTAVTAAGTSASSAPSAPVTPAGPTVSIRITQSGRNGAQVFARGTTTGITSGDTVTAQVRNKAGAPFRPAGQVSVQDDGTFSWTTNSGKKTWVRFTSGGVTSNTVIIGAR